MIYIFILYGLIFPIFLKNIFNNLLDKQLYLIIFYLLIIANTILVFVVIRKCIKYDIKLFKANNNIDYNKLVLELQKHDENIKFIIKDEILIIINKSGIYEFVYKDIQGILKGNIKDKTWLLNNKEINNPFIKLKNTNYYYILNNKTHFQVKGVWLTTKRTIIETINKNNNKNLYSKKEIDKIYNDLSNSVKKIDNTCKK